MERNKFLFLDRKLPLLPFLLLNNGFHIVVQGFFYRFHMFCFMGITSFLRSLPWFFRDYFVYKKRDVMKRFSTSFTDLYPCVLDKSSSTDFEPHYMYHPAWAARKVQQIHPKKHIDISSTLSFSTILSAFVPVEFYDYRPANIHLDHKLLWLIIH